MSEEDIIELKICLPVPKVALEWDRERLRECMITLASIGIDNALKDTNSMIISSDNG